MPEWRIRSNERVAFVGKTGSGKTTMARFLTRALGRFVVFDPKGTIGLAAEAWNVEPWSERGLAQLRKPKGLTRLVVPGPGPDDDPFGYWIPYLRAIFELGNVTLYIDEMYAVNRPGTFPSAELMALYTRGRELGIGVWAATQRPTLVPLVMLSECEWLFTFRLLLEQDRKRMAEICGPMVLDSVRDPYGYWLYNTAWDVPIYSRGLAV